MNAKNGDPLRSADAMAFAAEDPAAKPPCPQHKEQLDRRTADPRGNFEFAIDAGRSSYFAVYCMNGFQAREVPANDNLRTNTRVSPDPVRLIPTDAELRRTGQEPSTAYRDAILLVLDDLSGNVRYFRGAGPDAFGRSRERLDPGDRKVVDIVGDRPSRDRARPSAPTDEATLTAGLRRILAGASADLRYFAAASATSFSSSLEKLTPVERDAVEALRGRPREVADVPPAGAPFPRGITDPPAATVPPR